LRKEPGSLSSRTADIDGTASYDPQYFDFLRIIEDRHFWFRARTSLLKKLLRDLSAELDSPCRILEIGCGNGNVLRWMRDSCPNGTVVGMDLFPEAVRLARSRAGCEVVAADIGLTPFRRSFHVVGAFDVLEHLEDDIQALENMRELLVRRGKLLLTVPAHPELWSYFDEASRHCRRYKLDELRKKLLAAGFSITFLTYYMAAMYPIIYFGRKLTTAIGRQNRSEGRAYELASKDFRIVPGLNGALAALLQWECDKVARRTTLPFGASLLAIAEVA
jgi:SAM-dependent methyltransferase